MTTRSPRHIEALAVLATENPADLSRLGLAAHEAELARQAADSQRRTVTTMGDTSRAMRLVAKRQDASNRAQAAREAQIEREAAEKVRAEKASEVELIHVDGYRRTFNAATAIRIVEAEGSQWRYASDIAPQPRGRFDGMPA